jgi:hypothetical protein
VWFGAQGLGKDTSLAAIFAALCTVRRLGNTRLEIHTWSHEIAKGVLVSELTVENWRNTGKYFLVFPMPYLPS